MEQINIVQKQEILYLNLKNIGELAFTTPVYIKFSYQSTEETCSNWTQAYIFIIKTLYERHTEQIQSLIGTNITNGKRIDFASKMQSTEMKAPKEINALLFVETNLNATDIVKKIKAILDICEEQYSDLTIAYIKKQNKLSLTKVDKTTSNNSDNTIQVELIVNAIKNAGGIAFYSKIYDEYSKLISREITYIQKKIINKFLKESPMFCEIKKGSGVWKISNEYKSKMQNKVNDKSHTKVKTPLEKLKKRIYKQFDKVKYIGDIIINNDEYKVLIDYLRLKLSSNRSVSQNDDDPVFAVALVQIGIKEYNGRYWSHLSSITGIPIDVNQHRPIGERFYNTLINHNKEHVDQNEIVNNILMHCFITERYAPDFFEFLFAYYQYDLDRNLEVHTKEMSDFLIACMKKAETSSRAFRIKKGTADATTANEIGCKIRIRNILKLIDKYLFEDLLPENSQNRITKYFCEWAKTSNRFSRERKKIDNVEKRGKKHFKSPYLKFDYKNDEFNIILPIQTVPLADDEQCAELFWKISYNDISYTIISETEDTVIGCRNIETLSTSIEPKDIFSNIQIELLKNDLISIRKFSISNDTIRFFDKDFDSINPNRNLTCEKIYAFTKREAVIESNTPYEKEHHLGLDLYSFYHLTTGDIIKKPDGEIISIGDEFKEGLKENYLVKGATVFNNFDTLPIFKKAPAIFIKMKSSAIPGTLLIINDKKFKLNTDDCITFAQRGSNNNYCIISLDNYCQQDGIYHIIIDVSSNRTNKEYNFAIIKNFEYEFIESPYVFKSKGIIKFNENLNVFPIDKNRNNTYSFDMNNETETLNISVNGFKVIIDIPVFKWKFNINDEWEIEKPDEIWYKELPNSFYFKLPSDKAILFSEQFNMDDENDGGNKEKITFNSDLNCYICDCRKISSWLDLGPTLHNLKIRLGDTEFKFLNIVTSCILASCELKNDITNKQLILKTTILGFSDCAVDIFYNGNLVAEKLELTSNGAIFNADKLFGKFDLVFYEFDDEDDDFGFGEPTYSNFDKKSFELVNSNSFLNKTITVDYITKDKKKEDSIFSSDKYDIKNTIFITVKSQDDEDNNIYYGISNCPTNPKLSGLNVQIEQFYIKDSSKALLFFFDTEEECYIDFLYNTTKKTLEISEDNESKYLRFTPDYYYHISVNKK